MKFSNISRLAVILSKPVPETKGQTLEEMQIAMNPFPARYARFLAQWQQSNVCNILSWTMLSSLYLVSDKVLRLIA